MTRTYLDGGMRLFSLIFTICLLLGCRATEATPFIPAPNSEKFQGEWLLIRMSDRESSFVPLQTKVSFNSALIDTSTLVQSRTCSKDHTFGNGVAMTLENCPSEHIQAYENRILDNFENAVSLTVSKSGRYMWIIDDKDKEVGFFQKDEHVITEPPSEWDLLLKNSYKSPTHWELIEMRGLDATIKSYLKKEDILPSNYDWKQTGLSLRLSTKVRYRSVGFIFSDICRSNSWLFDRRDERLKFYQSIWQPTTCGVISKDANGNVKRDEGGEPTMSYFSNALWRHIDKIASKFHSVDVLNDGQNLVLKNEALETLASFKRKEASQ